jgi:hypothetical protein
MSPALSTLRLTAKGQWWQPSQGTPRPVLVNLRACDRLDLRVQSRLRTPFLRDPWASGLSRKALAFNPQVPPE